MVKPITIVVHFTTCLFILHLFHSKAYANSDLEALTAFKAASDAANKLTSWNSTSNPCGWSGVSCLHNRVSRLVLEDLDLRGSFEPLTALTQLRVLSLKRNRLSGPIPNLSNLKGLKLLFLSGNGFSGEFPPSVPTLSRLYRLDLSYNNLSGEVPVKINGLTRLLTLRLEENHFSGSISGINLLNLQDFNVSGNQLSGEVPRSLSGFPESAFAQNHALCGSPMQKCKNISTDPTRPGSDGAIASPLMPGTNPTTIVASSPSSLPSSSIPSKSANNHHARTSKLSPVALIAIILGDVFVLAVVSLILYCYFWRSYATKMREGKRSKLLESEKIVYSSSPYTAQPGFERGRMVFFEGVKRFELEDLLRASAEMLGKGGFGTAYKAVLDDGNVVAVKRLKDASVGGKREFEQHMELLGRLRHPNVVSLRAYYFAREEKLLVYDYMPNASLFWLLHGMFPFFAFAFSFFFPCLILFVCQESRRISHCAS
jgi:Leucine-rich repeat (LRR) protein